MNIRILLLLPLLLGVSVNGWTAPAKCVDSSLPGCKVDSEPAFRVHMEAGAVDGVVTSVVSPDCSGTTTQPKLSVNFPRDYCGKVTAKITPDGTVSTDLYLFSIAVKNTKKETSAMLFFTSLCCAYPPPNETVFSTGRLLVTIEVTGLPEEAKFLIDVNKNTVPLTKLHQDNKGTVLHGKIYVGDIVYTEST